jgi:segregation and condensation protein A
LPGGDGGATRQLKLAFARHESGLQYRLRADRSSRHHTDPTVTGANGAVALDEGAFFVELDRFQGPLDLLLHLIREQDIDIFDIPIAQITAQFLLVIEGVERLGLDRAGEFLEMAAMLIRIKAQMILPRREDEAGVLEDPRAQLVRRLLEYEHFREAAQRLESAESDRRRHHARGHVPPRERPIVEPELVTTWDDVFTAALGIGDRTPELEEHRVASRMVHIEDKMALIAQTLVRIERVEFRHLVAPFAEKIHGVITLMAGLEMARRRQLGMQQLEPFTSLWLYRRKDSEPDAPHADH